MSPTDDAVHRSLLADARRARANAHAPYSDYRVGAAVLTEAGGTYAGCNVENASYGLSCCAERSAIFAAVAAEGGGMRLRAVAVAGGDGPPCVPCGACRQVIAEFGRDTAIVFELDGRIEVRAIDDLLPLAFRLGSRR